MDWNVKQICESLCKAAEHYYEEIEDKRLFKLDDVVIENW